MLHYRLKRHLNPHGRLYVIGMNPIPDSATPPADIISEIRQARDACILLAGHRPYRYARHTPRYALLLLVSLIADVLIMLCLLVVVESSHWTG